MYDYVNNKFKIREDLKPYTNILDYKFLLGVELEKYFLKVWQNKKTFSLSFVVQEEYGFAGENTFIFTKENLKNQLKLIKNIRNIAFLFYRKIVNHIIFICLLTMILWNILHHHSRL